MKIEMQLKNILIAYRALFLWFFLHSILIFVCAVHGL